MRTIESYKKQMREYIGKNYWSMFYWLVVPAIFLGVYEGKDSYKDGTSPTTVNFSVGAPTEIASNMLFSGILVFILTLAILLVIYMIAFSGSFSFLDKVNKDEAKVGKIRDNFILFSKDNIKGSLLFTFIYAIIFELCMLASVLGAAVLIVLSSAIYIPLSISTLGGSIWTEYLISGVLILFMIAILVVFAVVIFLVTIWLTSSLISWYYYRKNGFSMSVFSDGNAIIKGHRYEIFVLCLSFIGWYILSILSVGLLYIFYVGQYSRGTVLLYINDLAREYYKLDENEIIEEKEQVVSEKVDEDGKDDSIKEEQVEEENQDNQGNDTEEVKEVEIERDDQSEYIVDIAEDSVEDEHIEDKEEILQEKNEIPESSVQDKEEGQS